MTYFDSLRFVQFFSTMECNMACDFCFNRGYQPVPGIAISDYRILIKKITDAGVQEIDILGGEPTLHPDFMKLIEIAIRHGMKVYVSSNGSNVESLTQLANIYKEETLAIGISLPGEVSGDLHEFITSYRPLLKNICPQEVAVPEAAIGYVESGMEYRLLYRDAVFSKDLAASIPFQNFFSGLQILSAQFPNVKGVYCDGFVSGESCSSAGRVRCPAGTTKLSILPDGSVYPCYLFIRNSQFMLGNILTDSLRTIWSNPLLGYFRELGKNKCPETRCVLHSYCRGGCPAQSLLIHGDLDAPDPRCRFR
jgi:radical SAM protein with 4Fe4S-binding SPASM domain